MPIHCSSFRQCSFETERPAAPAYPECPVNIWLAGLAQESPALAVNGPPPDQVEECEQMNE
jgi:hypothetical protein